jgi:hypothetical protein
MICCPICSIPTIRCRRSTRRSAPAKVLGHWSGPTSYRDRGRREVCGPGAPVYKRERTRQSLLDERSYTDEVFLVVFQDIPTSFCRVGSSSVFCCFDIVRKRRYAALLVLRSRSLRPYKTFKDFLIVTRIRMSRAIDENAREIVVPSSTGLESAAMEAKCGAVTSAA